MLETIVRPKKPNTPGTRHAVDVVTKGLHKGRPYSPLVVPLERDTGRNHSGQVTMRYRGGGHKRLYRLIDFKRNKDDVTAVVERFEYDPNRSAHIALLLYKDGERRYIIAPRGLKQGTELLSGVNAPIKVGNALPLSAIPVGTTIHGIELKPGKGAQLARSAGAGVQLIAKDGAYVTVRLRSGEMRKILASCRATVGEVGHSEHALRQLGKAGVKRHMGIKPHVRGVAKNPVDHPMGGGEGRTSGGRHPVSPWGVPAKGYRTRSKRKSNKHVVRSRHSVK